MQTRAEPFIDWQKITLLRQKKTACPAYITRICRVKNDRAQISRKCRDADKKVKRMAPYFFEKDAVKPVKTIVRVTHR